MLQVDYRLAFRPPVLHRLGYRARPGNSMPSSLVILIYRQTCERALPLKDRTTALGSASRQRRLSWEQHRAASTRACWCCWRLHLTRRSISHSAAPRVQIFRSLDAAGSGYPWWRPTKWGLACLRCTWVGCLTYSSLGQDYVGYSGFSALCSRPIAIVNGYHSRNSHRL
jgi:hypothetical protein